MGHPELRPLRVWDDRVMPDSQGRLPVAPPGGWFERRAVGGGITHITEPHVDPFLRCNCWHVRGRDADLLVDTGLGIVSLLAYAVDLFAGRRVIAVATHYHFDHVGSLHEFDERLIHGSEAEIIEDRARIDGWLRFDREPNAAPLQVEEAGYVLPADGELLSAVPTADFDRGAYSVVPCTATRTIDDGDELDLGDRIFQVLHLPGHSPGSIGLWEEETGVLFSGDAVYDGPLLDENANSDIAAYRDTMRRLAVLPVNVVHGGHEPSFGRARLVELCDAYLMRRAP
jgi:glyoxylase-like metal-dependent hydrolase (beta-lactamase superfamily II)